MNGIPAGKNWTWVQIEEMKLAYIYWGPVGLATAWGYHGA